MAGLLLSFVSTQAQEQCGFDHLHEHLLQTDEVYKAEYEKNMALRADLPLGESNSSFTIPVMVWVFHNDGPENISRAQILDALDVVNRDIKRLNADTSNTNSIFKPVAGAADIEFKLATIGPGGECTDGIVRIKTDQTSNAPQEIKLVGAAANADNVSYLNIYVVQSIENFFGTNGTILGYANLPSPGQSPFNDGVVMRHDCMGTIGTATGGFGLQGGGRTLTHEIGHYLGLLHTFDGGCSGPNDGFSDTPPVVAPNSGCNWGNSCSTDSPDLPDQGENYMDYTNGVCQNMFSVQQVNRMVNSLNGTRNGLVNAQNLLETGVSTPGPTCAPVAYIGMQRPYVCLGDSIEVYDYSWNGAVTSRQWSVVNSGLPVLQDSAVSIGFNTPGMYTVQLSATNGQGSSSTTRVVNVFDTAAIVPGFFNESFEAPFPFGSNFQIQPEQMNLSWAVNTSAANSGSQSMYVRNFNKEVGTKEELILPALNMTQQGPSMLEFSYAFASKNVDNDDVLRVWVSMNCGRTWIPRKFLSGDALETAPMQPAGEFAPTSGQWESTQVSLAPYQLQDHILVKFEFTSGGGNNFYLDDLRIYDPLSLDEEGSLKVNIYPNPTAGRFHIDLEPGVEADIEVRDLTGRLVHEGRYEGPSELNASTWSAGTYVVIIRSQSAMATQKLIKK